MIDFYRNNFKNDISAVMNGVPVGIIIFLTFLYLIIVGTVVHLADGVLYSVLLGFSFYFLYMFVIKGFLRLMFRNKDLVEDNLERLRRGLDRIVGAFLVWSVTTNYYPKLRLFDADSVMSKVEDVQFENTLVMLTMSVVYIIWYILFGNKEKIEIKSKIMPKIDL